MLSGQLGTAFVDTDAEVEAVAGKPVGDIFVDDGEPAFRELERAAAERALAAGGAVVALGSGAVLDPAVQAAARRAARGLPGGRRSPRSRAASAWTGRGSSSPATRAAGSAACSRNGAPSTSGWPRSPSPADDLAPEEITDEIAAWLEDTGERRNDGHAYPRRRRASLRGSGRHRRARRTARPGRGESRTVFVVYAGSVAHIAHPACRALEDAGDRVLAEPVPDGEAAKQVTVAAGLWSRLAAERAGRTDFIVGIGGGAVTDLAGFVASTWLRGVRVVLVPTTLLGMVDAAIGGKTAVDIPEGKNLVGAFHAPAGVLADLSVLETVPRADYVAGLAEIIKAGFVADPVILDLVEDDPAGATVPHGRQHPGTDPAGYPVQGAGGGGIFARSARARRSTTATPSVTRSSAPRSTGSGRRRGGDRDGLTPPSPAGCGRRGKTVVLHRSVLVFVGLLIADRPDVWRTCAPRWSTRRCAAPSCGS